MDKISISLFSFLLYAPHHLLWGLYCSACSMLSCNNHVTVILVAFTAMKISISLLFFFFFFLRYAPHPLLWGSYCSARSMFGSQRSDGEVSSAGLELSACARMVSPGKGDMCWKEPLLLETWAQLISRWIWTRHTTLSLSFYCNFSVRGPLLISLLIAVQWWMRAACLNYSLWVVAHLGRLKTKVSKAY